MHPAFWIGGNINQRALCLYLLIVAAWRRAVSCALAAAIEKNLANDSESIDRSGNTLVAKGWTTQVQQSSGIDGARGMRGVQAVFSDRKTAVRIATATRSTDCFADLGNHFGIQHLLGYYSYTTDLNESCTTRQFRDIFSVSTPTENWATTEIGGPVIHQPLGDEYENGVFCVWTTANDSVQLYCSHKSTTYTKGEVKTEHWVFYIAYMGDGTTIESSAGFVEILVLNFVNEKGDVIYPKPIGTNEDYKNFCKTALDKVVSMKALNSKSTVQKGLATRETCDTTPGTKEEADDLVKADGNLKPARKIQDDCCNDEKWPRSTFKKAEK